MIKRITFMLILIMLSACVNSEPVLIKKDSPPDDPNKDPKLIEQENDEEIDTFIEFALPNEEVMINLEMTPILNSYLQATKNRQKVIEGMDLKQIDVIDRNIYLLEFSCENNKCSYLLLDQSKDNQAYLVADLAKITNTKLSPDNTKIVLQFTRETEKLPTELTNIVVIDLKEWEHLQLINQTNDKDILNFTWPIEHVNWTDDNTLSVAIPNVTKPTEQLIQEWQISGGPALEIEFGFEN